MEATVKEVVRQTPRVYSVTITLPEPIAFRTGQVMRWTGHDGKTGRLFSIANHGDDAVTELSFVISIFPDGIVSSHIPYLKPGDTVDVRGPFGKFIFDDADTRDIALIAGGTGISVLRAIYLHVLSKGLPNRIKLLFSVRNAEEIIFRQELEYLAARYPQFAYQVTLTRETPATWQGKRGTINGEMLSEVLGADIEDWSVYLCGPVKFVQHVEGLLKDKGISEERIHIDRWVF